MTILVGSSIRGGGLGVLDDFEAELFDDRIGEDLARDLLDFGLGGGAVEALKFKDEEFSLAYVTHGGMAEGRQGVLDGGALRVEHGALQHDPDMCFHAGIIQERVLCGAGKQISRRFRSARE